jgi:hypothetical protein
MIRRCDGSDRNLRGINGMPCDCGLVFDDVEITTTWPHSPVGPKPTLEEIDRMITGMFGTPGMDLGPITPVPFANPDPDDDYSDIDLDPHRADAKPLDRVVLTTNTGLTETTTRLTEPIYRIIRHDRTPARPLCDQEATVTAAGLMVVHGCTRFADHAPDRKHLCPCRFTWETAR